MDESLSLFSIGREGSNVEGWRESVYWVTSWVFPGSARYSSGARRHGSVEETHIHHVTPKQYGGKDDLVNLRLVHRNCHHQIHSIRAPVGVRRLLEPGAR